MNPLYCEKSLYFENLKSSFDSNSISINEKWMKIFKLKFTQSMAENGSEESSELEMQQQLPDAVLRPIFKHLPAFSDIKNCRLVCKQWHRHALDNINFILAAEHLGPSKNPAKRFFLSSADRYHFKLAAMPATSDEAKIERLAECEIIEKLPFKFLISQLAEAVDAIKDKIKFVQLVVKPTKQISAILRDFCRSFPAIEQVVAAEDSGNHVSVWSAFQRARQFPSQVSQDALRLKGLALRTADVESLGESVHFELLGSQADSICRIAADNWLCIQLMLIAHESSNDNQPLIFEQCNSLWLSETPGQPIVNPILKISEHFPELRRLKWPIDVVAPSPDFDNLQKLTKLTYLVFIGEQPQVVHWLRLPNLESLVFCGHICLPDNPAQFFLPNIRSVSIGSDGNLRRLADLLHHDKQCLATLEKLRLKRDVEQTEIDQYLPAVLSATNKLETLTLENWFFEGSDMAIASSVCRIVAAAASPSLAEINVGHYEVPSDYDRLNCFGLVQRLVGWMKRSEVKALMAVGFCDNGSDALAKTLTTLNALSDVYFGDGDVVASRLERQESIDVYELAWRNDVGGNQQKLHIRVGDRSGRGGNINKKIDFYHF